MVWAAAGSNRRLIDRSVWEVQAWGALLTVFECVDCCCAVAPRLHTSMAFSTTAAAAAAPMHAHSLLPFPCRLLALCGLLCLLLAPSVSAGANDPSWSGTTLTGTLYSDSACTANPQSVSITGVSLLGVNLEYACQSIQVPLAGGGSAGYITGTCSPATSGSGSWIVSWYSGGSCSTANGTSGGSILAEAYDFSATFPDTVAHGQPIFGSGCFIAQSCTQVAALPPTAPTVTTFNSLTGFYYTDAACSSGITSGSLSTGFITSQSGQWAYPCATITDSHANSLGYVTATCTPIGYTVSVYNGGTCSTNAAPVGGSLNATLTVSRPTLGSHAVLPNHGGCFSYLFCKVDAATAAAYAGLGSSSTGAAGPGGPAPSSGDECQVLCGISCTFYQSCSVDLAEAVCHCNITTLWIGLACGIGALILLLLLFCCWKCCCSRKRRIDQLPATEMTYQR